MSVCVCVADMTFGGARRKKKRDVRERGIEEGGHKKVKDVLSARGNAA